MIQKYDTPQEIITKDEEYKEFLSANNSEKRVILIYKLLHNRAIKKDMLMPPQEQKDFIRQIIKLFPDMIKVSRDCA